MNIILKRTSYILLVSTLTFLACHTRNAPASAGPGLSLPPVELGSINLTYTDTNSAEWKNIARRLDSFYRLQAAAGFNGSVLVGYKGQILYERYIGFADRAAGRMLDKNAGVQLASTSKTFTAAAILYLHQNKYLDIYKPVAEYLPGFPYPDVTVWMCLNHRSGLPDYEHFIRRKGALNNAPLSNAELMDSLRIRKPAKVFASNTHFKYCNTNYAVLASLIEAVTELSYPDFMTQYIFTPLGMKNTYVFNAATGARSNATVSYNPGYSIFKNDWRDGIYGDKNIYSTVEDMYRWDQSFYQNKFLSNETLELAYGPCSFEMRGIKNYGLGWRMLCYPDGYKIIYHNGWWHGNNTCFYRFIKDNFTIIVLGNKRTNAVYRQPPVIYSIVKNADAVGGFEDTEE